MKRIPTWGAALNATLEAAGRSGFDWATNNCVSMCCDCVLAMTGEDPGAAYRDTFSDEASAMAIVAASGDLFDFIANLLGEAPMDNPAYAKDGDIWVVDIASGPLAGIGVHSSIWCLSDAGFVRIPRRLALSLRSAAWSIGW